MERVATVNNGGIPGVYDINLFVIKDTWSVLQYLAIFDRYTDCHYTLEFADSNDELLETVLEICKFRGILNKRLESLQEPLDDYDRVVVSSNIVNVLDNLKDTKKIPAKVDLFTYEDWKNVIKFIDETEKNVVIDATLHKSILEKFEEEYNRVLENITIFEKDEAHIILIKNK